MRHLDAVVIIVATLSAWAFYALFAVAVLILG
jgi:hypothetical protein